MSQRNRGIPAARSHDILPVVDAEALARTVSRLIGARIIILFSEQKNHLKVVAAFGTSIRQLPNDWRVKRDPGSLTDVRVVKDLSRASDLAAHPINSVVPPVKSLLAVWSPDDGEHSYCLLAIDPSRKAATDHVILEGIQNIMASLRDMTFPGPADPRGFAEQSAAEMSGVTADAPTSDAVTRFLLNTLVKQRRLHTRGEADFVSLRRWRSSIKPFQLEALKALKASPSVELIDTAADEICSHATRQLSSNAVKYVVPIPCGSSGGTDCLSVRLARKVAEKLEATYHPVLTPKERVAKGSSHPKKSAALQGYHCDALPDGPYLLIDDVATSGRHLELACRELRAANHPMAAIVWLGMG